MPVAIQIRDGSVLRDKYASFGGGQRLGHIFALVLEQVAEVLVGHQAKQLAAPLEHHRELEIREIGLAVGAAQPVLRLVEIVVCDAGAMQRAQGRRAVAKIGNVADAALPCRAARRR